MRKSAQALLFAALLSSGCSMCRKDEIPPPPLPSTQTICVELTGNPRLHWFQGEPHSLYVRMYTLSKAEGFMDAGLTTARLVGEPPPSVANAIGNPQAATVYPGRNTRVTIDVPTADGAALGIAAAYYEPRGQTKLIAPVAGASSSACLLIRFGEAAIDGASVAPQKGPQ